MHMCWALLQLRLRHSTPTALAFSGFPADCRLIDSTWKCYTSSLYLHLGRYKQDLTWWRTTAGRVGVFLHLIWLARPQKQTKTLNAAKCNLLSAAFSASASFSFHLISLISWLPKIMRLPLPLLLHPTLPLSLCLRSSLLAPPSVNASVSLYLALLAPTLASIRITCIQPSSCPYAISISRLDLNTQSLWQASRCVPEPLTSQSGTPCVAHMLVST